MKNCILIINFIGVRIIVFNATFNNISAISWWSVLLVDETGVPWENHRPVASHWLYHTMLYRDLSTPRHELKTSVMIGIDCIVSCKSNYYTITTMIPVNYTWPETKWTLENTEGAITNGQSREIGNIYMLSVLKILTYKLLDLRYLFLFTYSYVQHIFCCVFVLFFFVLCILCYKFLWIVHFWLSLRYSLTFIYYKVLVFNC